MPETSTTAVHGPYEDAVIALMNLITVVIEGQPPEVKAELWKLYLEDVKAWRAFWGLKNVTS